MLAMIDDIIASKAVCSCLSLTGCVDIELLLEAVRMRVMMSIF